MSLYQKDGIVNITEWDIRSAFPNVSFPSPMELRHVEPFGYSEYIPSEPEIAPPTPEEIIAALTNDVQQHLDSTARTKNYDGILSACTYATSSIPKFAAEGQACVRWRDTVWATCYAHMELVLAGKAPIPTAEELIAMLPVMEWPA